MSDVSSKFKSKFLRTYTNVNPNVTTELSHLLQMNNFTSLQYVTALYYFTRTALQLPLAISTEILLVSRTPFVNINNPSMGQVYTNPCGTRQIWKYIFSLTCCRNLEKYRLILKFHYDCWYISVFYLKFLLANPRSTYKVHLKNVS